MASKEVKSSLKSAREAIRNKEFKEALKHCKAVLKVDKNNYNALVFIGLCASEMEQADQAKMAYKKAIDVDPTQLLAWQGLSNLCEKLGTAEAKDELAHVYEKLVLLYESSDKNKWKETVGKLSDLYKNQGELHKAVNTLKTLLGSAEEQDGDFHIWCQIIDTLEKKVQPFSEEQIELQEAYRSLVHTEWRHVDCSQIELYHGNYIRFLLRIEVDEEDELRQDIHETIIEEARVMTQTYSSAAFPLEVQGKMFLEDQPVVEECLSPEVADVFQRLCDLEPSSGIGTIGLGYTLLCQKDHIMARDLLKRGLQSYAHLPVGWLYLSQLQVRLHDYSSAEKNAKKGLECITKFSGRSRRNILHTLLRLLEADSLVKQGRYQEGVKIYQQLLETSQHVLQVLTGLGNAHLALGEISQATEFCKKALDIDKCCADALALQGQVSFQEGLFDDAELRILEAIDQKKDCAYYYFLLGKLYWEMNGNLRADKSKCAAQFLKAAKLDPYYSPTFLYLGHYYQKVAKDTSKACRCFQKAFDLDPDSEAAGIALGDLLIETGQEEAALALCTSVTSVSAPGRAKWAWLRLGLVRLKNDESTEAISCFQSALRADLSDKHCWECLGEAYLSRGSYTAALKAFTKASQLDSSSIYCLFQMAAIKQTLGVYNEAIREYQLIMEKQPDYVPALKGLGETNLCLARSSLQQDLNGRAVDHVTEGLRALARAVESRPGLSCLWKLIGDCCSVVCPVAECCVRVALPENLKRIIPGEHTEAVYNKRELLALATSSYGRALKVQPHCASLWNDLGYSYFLQLKVADGSEREKLAQRAVQALKKGLGMQPSNHKLWNTLGVMTASPEINNPELSQHSFIMSIKTEPNNVVAWTNLAVLYLKHHKIELAHEAFKNAQALEPSYTAAWIGQASIAEIIGSEEAMDLFRHTTELGSHVEGSLGYAHWLCTCLIPDKPDVRHVTIEGQPAPSLSHLPVDYRRAVVQASVALSKYTDRIRHNAGAYNMYGLLMEHQKLFIQADKAYSSAIKLLQEGDVNPELLNAVYVNHARVLCLQGRYKDAIVRYQSVKPLVRFHDVCGLALALFMSGQVKESYQAYEQALQLTESGADKSCVLAAMGMIGYALTDKAGAKGKLFESSQLTPPCERGLMALCALGLVTSDVTLAGAALSELMKLEERGNKQLTADICYFFSRFYALQGNQKIGRSHIVKAIHRYPDSDLLWTHLAAYVIQACPDDLQAAACCAEAATRVSSVSTAHSNSSLQPAGLLGSGAFFCRHANMPSVVTATHRTRAALRASQKAVHAHPEHVTNWAVLSAAVTAQGIAQKVNNATRFPNALGTRLSQFLTDKVLEERAALQLQSQAQLPVLLVAQNALLEAVQAWALLHTGYSTFYSGLIKEASAHTEEALSVCSSSPQATAGLQLLKAQISLHSGEAVEVGMNAIQATVLSSPYQSAQAWQVLAQVQANLQASPMAAELCYRQCLQAAGTDKSRAGRLVPLIRLAFLAFSMAQNETKEQDRWISLCHEAAAEVLKLSPGCAPALLIQGVAHFLQDNSRSAKRILHQVAETNSSAASLARYWLLLFYIKKNDQAAIKLLLSGAMRAADNRVDLLYYQLSRDPNASSVTKRRLLQKCVHHNPATPLYWTSLAQC